MPVVREPDHWDAPEHFANTMGRVIHPILPIQWKKLDLLGIIWGCSDVLGGALVLVLV